MVKIKMGVMTIMVSKQLLETNFTVERFVKAHASIANGFTEKEQCSGLHVEVNGAMHLFIFYSIVH